mmetsp:Transcript_1788/g.3301  ORF Transcript_1788/g.3301 Transcript_1788/m.3301 type:complete len:207 (-) Transcript_1788:2833-3453(-)
MLPLSWIWIWPFNCHRFDWKFCCTFGLISLLQSGAATQSLVPMTLIFERSKGCVQENASFEGPTMPASKTMFLMDKQSLLLYTASSAILYTISVVTGTSIGMLGVFLHSPPGIMKGVSGYHDTPVAIMTSSFGSKLPPRKEPNWQPSGSSNAASATILVACRSKGKTLHISTLRNTVAPFHRTSKLFQTVLPVSTEMSEYMLLNSL